jgi:hypothetical protein
MFYLDKPNGTQPTFIFFKPYVSDGRLNYPVSTKIKPAKVHPDHWLMEAHRIDKKFDTDRINILLNRIETAFDDLETEARKDGVGLTKEGVTQALDIALGRTEQVKRSKGAPEFYKGLEDIIKDRKSGDEVIPKGKKKGQRFSAATITSYEQCVQVLHSFDPHLTFEGISMKTHAKLITFMQDDLQASLNYIGFIIKKFKTLMGAAATRKWHKNTICEKPEFYAPEEETEAIYHDEKELADIYSVMLSDPKMDAARDWYIIGCMTGLRLADLTLLEDRNNLPDSIGVFNEKTNAKVIIPKRPEVKAILEKWNGFPPDFKKSSFNYRIKKVCQLAGINSKILYSINKGGEDQAEYLEKWEMASPHTARRTLITLLLEDGVPDNQVMALAGITQHETLLKYKKTKAEKAAKIAAALPFFTGKSAKLRAV